MQRWHSETSRRHQRDRVDSPAARGPTGPPRRRQLGRFRKRTRGLRQSAVLPCHGDKLLDRRTRACWLI